MTMRNSAPGSAVVGVFEDREDAREAIEALKDAGFSSDAISILSPDKQATQEIADDTGAHAGSGAATGAVAGGILGGLGGWLLGIGALAIPGVGPFIAAGAFATALGGAALGAGLGAIAGALVSMGVPEEHAKYYEGEARAGKTLVTVRANGRFDEAQEILRDHGAYDVESRQAGFATTGAPATGATVLRDTPRESERSTAPRAVDGGEESLQLREEELLPHKERVQTGQVEIGKEVVSEQRTVDVPVTREEVTIERTPVERRPSDLPMDDRGQTISVPVYEEKVELEKRAFVYEEVGVAKREVQDTQQVSGTVRREEARIEREGDVAGAATSGRTWEQSMPGYRERWQQRYGATGNRWEDAEPGYRYGYEMRDRSEYRGRPWSEVEPQAQRDWSQRHPNTPWERARESVREAWEDTRNR